VPRRRLYGAFRLHRSRTLDQWWSKCLRGQIVGMIDDFWQRLITDIGLVGPGRGKGAKYLITPPGYKGKRPDGMSTKSKYHNMTGRLGPFRGVGAIPCGCLHPHLSRSAIGHWSCRPRFAVPEMIGSGRQTASRKSAIRAAYRIASAHGTSLRRLFDRL
jgi:hypothetical protein